MTAGRLQRGHLRGTLRTGLVAAADHIEAQTNLGPMKTASIDLALNLLDADSVSGKLDDLKNRFPIVVTLLERHGAPLPTLRQFGSMCRRAENYELAMEAFVAALSLAPTDVRLWRDLSSIYECLSRDELAETCLRKALELEIVHADTWLRLAILTGRREATPKSRKKLSSPRSLSIRALRKPASAWARSI